MSEQEIIEGNKLIAEFMGLREQTDPTERWLGHWFSGSERFDRLHYNTSWDWLMSVVDKIYSLDKYYKYKMYLNPFESELKDLFPNIEKVYEFCLDFIKWYNQQNKS